jgi:hypothetical protein
MFNRNECPLCGVTLLIGQEDLAHLLVTCRSHKVKTCRHKYLEQCISTLNHTKTYTWEGPRMKLYFITGGSEHQSLVCEKVISIYLQGGLIRPINVS